MTIKYLTLVILMFLGVSCNKDEDEIIPNDNVFNSDIRFTFPQGDSEYDRTITDIYRKFGVQLVYKDIDSIYLFKQWVKPTGASSYKYNVMTLSSDITPKLVEYLNDKFFKYLPETNSTKIFPTYFYLLNNYGSWIANVYWTDSFLEKKMEEFWIVAPADSMYTNPSNQDLANIFAKKMIYGYLGRAFVKGLITTPEGLTEGMDFKTAFDNANPNSPNYYLNRGMVDNMGGATFDVITTAFIYKRKLNIPYSPYNSQSHFHFMTQIALYYTPTEFLEKYGSYPLVMNSYNKVINHFMDNYGIDIKKIADELPIMNK